MQKGTDGSANPMEDGRGDRFAYDNEGQLTDAWYNALDPNGNTTGWTRKDHFDYDALGNRQGSSNNVASRNSGLDQINFGRRDNGLNQYSDWSPSTIYHDDNYPGWSAPGNGVMMAEGWVTASYNALNQPIAIWSPNMPGGAFTWFGYDPLGRCVKRWISDSGDVYSNPAIYFQYDGWDLLQEGTNAWGPARVYVHGNRMDEIVWSYNTFTGEQAFHHYDTRGHCTLLTDSFGGILEQYEYDAFGQAYFYDAAGSATTVNGQPGSPFGNRFLFTGREWLSDLHLCDYRTRMYQPELGRFLQPDPKEFAAGDYNLYRYCGNDPVNRNDPMGLWDSWSNAMWMQGGSTLSAAVSDELKRLHANGYVTVAQISYAKPAGRSPPTVNDFAGFYNAAKPTFDPIYGSVLKEKTEFFSRIDKNDKTGARIVGRVTRGSGVNDYDDDVAKGRAETSEINDKGLARGYRVEGYVLGHRFYDPWYIQNDMKRAAQHGWHSIYITPPQTRPRFVPEGMQIIPYDYTKPEPTLISH